MMRECVCYASESPTAMHTISGKPFRIRDIHLTVLNSYIMSTYSINSTYTRLLHTRELGIPVWRPGDTGDRFRIGDVCYILPDKIHRLFNAMLASNDEAQIRFGVPNQFQPCGKLDNQGSRTDQRNTIDGCVVASQGLQQVHLQNSDPAGYHFISTEETSALFVLNADVTRHQSTRSHSLRFSMLKNYSHWLEFARRCTNDATGTLVAVYSCMTATQYAMAVVKNSASATISFRGDFGLSEKDAFLVSNSNRAEMECAMYSSSEAVQSSKVEGSDASGPGKDWSVCVRCWAVKPRESIANSADVDASRASSANQDAYDPIGPVLDYILKHHPEVDAALVEDQDILKMCQVHLLAPLVISLPRICFQFYGQQTAPDNIRTFLETTLPNVSIKNGVGSIANRPYEVQPRNIFSYRRILDLFTLPSVISLRSSPIRFIRAAILFRKRFSGYIQRRLPPDIINVA
ncbi:hypothetical protein B0H21DRAFT_551126 [Amylocystis lapponica]|nr:hypothetical protein B0H21DRAFT_551126 [Amylocystis lapponica]